LGVVLISQFPKFWAIVESKLKSNLLLDQIISELEEKQEKIRAEKSVPAKKQSFKTDLIRI